MQQVQLLEKIIQFLEDNNIEYLITGSYASSLQGTPRSTHDIDIVVMLNSSVIDLLKVEFSPPQYYFSEEAALDAIKLGSMFNIIDTTGGGKIDFWIFKDEDFNISRFQRKYEEKILGFKMNVSAPEDTILAKLNWIKKYGGSEKHLIDALRIYELQYADLDKSYLEEWSRKLGITNLFEEIKRQANPLL